MGVIEEVSRYDPYVNDARMASMKHFVERSERSIRRLQQEGQADPRVHPALASDALGAMVARFAELGSPRDTVATNSTKQSNS